MWSGIGQNEGNFLSGVCTGIIDSAKNNLNESQITQVINDLNIALPSMEYITNLAAYYALNGYFPNSNNNNSIVKRNKLFNKPSTCLKSLINREYNR